MRKISPANMSTPITFAFAGSFVGSITTANGNRLNMQAQAGREVLLVTTGIRKEIANVSMPR